MHSLSRSRFLGSSALLALAASGPAAAQTPAPALRLRIGAIPFDPAGVVFYAQDQGFFDRAGLAVDVMPMTSGGAIAAAVVSGALDVGFTNAFSALTAYGHGIPVDILAPSTIYTKGKPYSAILVAKDAPYRTAKDLNGRTVAVDGIKGLTQIATQAWVDKFGGDSMTLKFVEIPEPNIGAAVSQGRVDAGTLQLTNVDLTPQSPTRILGDPYEGIAPRFYPAVWFATRPWVEAHREETRRFTAALRQAAHWANTNQGASADVLMRIAKLTPERMAALSTHRVLYGEVLDQTAIQPLIDVAARYGLITASFSAKALM